MARVAATVTVRAMAAVQAWAWAAIAVRITGRATGTAMVVDKAMVLDLATGRTVTAAPALAWAIAGTAATARVMAVAGALAWATMAVTGRAIRTVPAPVADKATALVLAPEPGRTATVTPVVAWVVAGTAATARVMAAARASAGAAAMTGRATGIAMDRVTAAGKVMDLARAIVMATTRVTGFRRNNPPVEPLHQGPGSDARSLTALTDIITSMATATPLNTAGIDAAVCPVNVSPVPGLYIGNSRTASAPAQAI